jgi:hypothetical protein
LVVRVGAILLVAVAIFAMSQAAAALAVGDSPDRPVFEIGIALFVVGIALVALSRVLAASERDGTGGRAERVGDGVQPSVSEPSPARH